MMRFRSLWRADSVSPWKIRLFRSFLIVQGPFILLLITNIFVCITIARKFRHDSRIVNED
jgi:hypothetical protein